MASLTTSILPDGFHFFNLTGLAVSAFALPIIGILYILISAIYNLYFHPLRHIPGPFLSRASGIPYNRQIRAGTIVQHTKRLHDQYGEVVRLSPGEVSFTSGETAWQDIYGFHTGSQKKHGQFLKDTRWYPKSLNGVRSVLSADEAGHSRMRRNLSHAFSDKALRDQEGLIQGYVDLLVQRLHEQVEEKSPVVDIMRWYNYTTFDIITDLTFGEPLYCLRDNDYHPWIPMVFASAKYVVLTAARLQVPILFYLDTLKSAISPLLSLVPSISTSKSQSVSQVSQIRNQFILNVRAKLATRFEQGTTRPDFLSHILANKTSPEKSLTGEEIEANSMTFLIAGSETTATALSGITYLILQPENRASWERLVGEIRGAFKTSDEITIDSVGKLKYMLACIQEGLRIYPPVPTGFPRVVPPGGDEVSGHYIPGGTSVYITQHATNHSARHFADPESWVPERWLDEEDDNSAAIAKKYKDDKRSVVNPFSLGPRNCLGKNLAYAELRLIVAKMLWNFDLELVTNKSDNSGMDWMKDQKCFMLWDKPALNVRLVPVKR